jgi:hypothetical protein
MTKVGLNIRHYMAFETDSAIAKDIRRYRKQLKNGNILGDMKVTVHNQEVLQFLTERQRATVCDGHVGLFHFDFCDALTPKYRPFMLMDGVAGYMGKRAAVIVTYSIRSKNNSDRLQLATTEYADLLGLEVWASTSGQYRDTTTMRTHLYLVERKKKSKEA